MQLGMLFSLLYVAFLCVWFWTTRHLRTTGAGLGIKHAGRRVLGRSAVDSDRSARARPPAKGEGASAGGANPQWTCEIAWQPGHLRFQAVMAPHDAPMAHLVGDAKGLRWPKGVHKPNTPELESALGALAASIAAAGWEPVQSRGPWSERRFVWRQEGEPPTSFELVGGAPAATAVAERSNDAARPSRARPARERAPRGANRDAVLRAVAARPGVTMRELAAATHVKRSSLPPLLRTLTLRGELEKRTRPDGQTGYALAKPVHRGGETKAVEVAGAREGSR
jgi:hypothetical protein